MRILKKYANRRLYDTQNSCYITLDDVYALILQFQRIKVIESSSGEDITDQILLQIIANLENNKSYKRLFTQNLLEQLIRVYSYDDRSALGNYLEQSLSFFVETANQGVNPMDVWMNLGQKQFDAWQKMFNINTQSNRTDKKDTPED